MTLYAFTDIYHGNKDGSVVEFKAGEEIKGVKDDALIAAWTEAGSVALYDRRLVEQSGGGSAAAEALAVENDQLRARIAELEAAAASTTDGK